MSVSVWKTDRTQIPLWNLLNGRNVHTTPQTASPSSNGGESWSRNQVMQKCSCMRGSTNVTISSFPFQWQCICKAHLGHTYIRCESTHFRGLVDTKLRSKVAYKLYNPCSWFQITWQSLKKLVFYICTAIHTRSVTPVIKFVVLDFLTDFCLLIHFLLHEFVTLHRLAAEKFFALLVDLTSTPILLFHSDPGIFVSITGITTGIRFVTCINFTSKAEGCIISKRNVTGVLIHVSCLHRTTSIQTHGWKTFWLSADPSCQYCSAYRCYRII